MGQSCVGQGFGRIPMGMPTRSSYRSSIGLRREMTPELRENFGMQNPGE